MAREEHGKRRVLLANPDEPAAGDFAYMLYDKAHPIHGDPETINRFRRELRGLRGQEVTLKMRGSRLDDEGNERRFVARRTFTLNRYSDVFGAGSAFASALHDVRERHSDEELTIYEVSIEPGE